MRQLLAAAAILLLAQGAKASVEDLSDRFLDTAAVKTDRYGGTDVLENFPMLVRISPEAIPGFDYALAGKNGANIRFTTCEYDEKGGTNVLERLTPHEIDTWDEAGTSLVWVRIHKLRAGGATRVRMWWNPRPGAALPANDPAAVWEGDWVSVHHLADAADSAAPGTDCELGRTARPTDEGAVGAALGSRAAATNDFILRSAATEAVSALTNGGFTASMWVRPQTLDDSSCDAQLVTRQARAGDPAWGAGFVRSPRTLRMLPGCRENEEELDILGAVWTELGSRGMAAREWQKLDLVFFSETTDGATNGWLEAWLNGRCLGRQASVNWWLGNGAGEPPAFALGGYASTNDLVEVVTTSEEGVETVVTNVTPASCGLFSGDIDEFRIRRGVIAADERELDSRLTAEYKQVREANYYTFDPVRRDGKLLNYWREEPSLSKSVWRAGEKAAVPNRGLAGYGAAEVVYVNTRTGARSYGVPGAVGSYRAVFTVEPGETDAGEYLGLEFSVGFTIEPGTDAAVSATPADFKYNASFTVSNVSERTDLAYFPMVVAIQNNSPAGFTYDKLVYGMSEEAIYRDVRFYDENGQSLDYEISGTDQSGVTRVWINMPSYANGRKVTMCWGRYDGAILQPVDPRRLWSSYAAVLHCDETFDGLTAAEGVSRDSTGNGYDGVPVHGNGESGGLGSMVNSTGVSGNGRNANSVWTRGGNSLELRNSENLNLGSTFTVSGWFHGGYGNIANTANMAIFSRPDAFRACLQLRAANTDMRFSPSVFNPWTGKNGKGEYDETVAGGTSIYGKLISGSGWEPNNAWYFITVTYSGRNVSVYLRNTGSGYTDTAYTYSNAFASEYAASGTGGRIEIGGDTTWSLPASGVVVEGGPGNLYGYFDEIRIWRGTADYARLDAEFELLRNPGSHYVWGAVTENPPRPLQNEWLETPSISKVSWAPGESGGVLSLGRSFGGGAATVTVAYANRVTGEITREMPTATGEYRAIITREGDSDWGGLEYELNFSIGEDTGGYGAVSGSARTMLANDDLSIAGAEVELQSYTDMGADWGVPHWLHREADGSDCEFDWDDPWMSYLVEGSEWNLYRGVNHEYRDADTNRLWGLMNVRLGNAFPNGPKYGGSGTEDLAPNQNYLPWNPHSRNLEDPGWEVGDFRQYAGAMLLRNAKDVGTGTMPAEICSPFYTNGIGTVYFDAVNGWTDNVTNSAGAANYRLELQVATGTVAGDGTPATDDQIASSETYNPYLRAAWRPVPMNVIKYVNGVATRFTTDSLVLDITAGGGVASFYRVYAPVESAEPMRFRIVRTAVDENYTLDPDNAFILVDNVICSEPSRRATVSPYGFYDPSKTYKEVVGQEIALVPPFPGAGDRVSVRARAFDRLGEDVTSEGWFRAVTMHYRWRYLSQSETSWQKIDLDPVNLKGLSTMVLPGGPGDIEYWFESSQAGEYYTYADYSGTGYGVPGWRELPISITNGYDGVNAGWFTRIREGSSDVESFVMVSRQPVSRQVDPSGFTVTDNPMELVSDGTWRCYYRTPKAIEEGIDVRFERRNLQKPGAIAFAWNTNRYVSAEAMAKTPYVSRLSESGPDDWMHVPVDALTGHLLFQLDESTLALTAIHADYQNFNDWSDANGASFVGSSSDTNSPNMSGSSPMSKTIVTDYSHVPDSVATNENWLETYDYGSFLPADWEVRRNFGAWDYGEGRFWYAGYLDERMGNAFQHAGQGRGMMDLLRSQHKPRGIESVSFCARLQQEVEWDQFAVRLYPDQTKNYTLMTRSAFDFQENCGFTGNATLSLCAYHSRARKNPGCYEARWEQITGRIENPGKGADERHRYWNHGYAPTGQRLTIYRWYSDGRQMKCRKLFSVNNADTDATPDWTMQMPATRGATSGLMPFFISCYNDDAAGRTYILAGVRQNPVGTTENVKSFGGSNWLLAGYIDNASDRLTGGSYGVQCANCDARILTPQFGDDRPALPKKKSGGEQKMLQSWWRIKVPHVEPDFTTNGWDTVYNTDYNGTYTDVKPGEGAAFAPRKDGRDLDLRYIDFSNIDWSYCAAEFGTIDEDEWDIAPGRVETDPEGYLRQRAGFKAAPVTQTVTLYLADPPSSQADDDYSGDWTISEDAWIEAGSCEITGFGQVSLEWVPEKIGAYEARQKAVRLRTGGSLDDIRTDVVLDNVEVRQWRGENEEMDANWGATSTVYTVCWANKGRIEMNAGRCDNSQLAWPCSIRGPLFTDDELPNIGRSGTFPGLGAGLGHVGFTYSNVRNADWLGDTPLILVQVCTNSVSLQTLKSLTSTKEESEGGWQTFASYTVRDLVAGYREGTTEGTVDVYFPRMHGVRALARVQLNPAVVDMVAGSTATNMFATVDIERVSFKNEPGLDRGCWWGCNLRTVGGESKDAEGRMYLPDWAIPQAPGSGMSLALNNSITNGADAAELADDPLAFAMSKPFVQSPTFTNAVIGEITFKARKYDGSPDSQVAELRLYGATADILASGEPWVELEYFAVSNSIFRETYSYRCNPDDSYCAFRLAVTGVKGVLDADGREETPVVNPPSVVNPYGGPARVLVDEIVVGEANRARLGFRNVGAFRSDLSGRYQVANVPSRNEQPICNEAWGVQCELYSLTLSDEIDWSREPKVTLHWYASDRPWGYAKWKDRSGAEPRAHSAVLTRVQGDALVYRSSYLGAPESVVTMSRNPGVVQYVLEAQYWVIDKKTGRSEPATSVMSVASGDWKRPDWFAPLDLNATNAGADQESWVAYNVLERVSPGWAWINEANILDSPEKGNAGNGSDSGRWQQYFEIAAPYVADMTGWSIRTIDNNGNMYGRNIITNTIATFGRGLNSVSAKKDFSYAASNMVFYVVANPASPANGTLLKPADGRYDGPWAFQQGGSVANVNSGVLNYYAPFGVQLVSPMGIVYHEAVVCGNNLYGSISSAYETDRIVELFNTYVGSSFFDAGSDDQGLPNSLSVLTSRGETSDDWKNKVEMTPGRINAGQEIVGRPPEPLGDSIVIYANVDTKGGHILQYVPELDVFTNAPQVFVAHRDDGMGGESGTNIIYQTDKWYEFGRMTADGVEMPVTPVEIGTRTWRVEVGRGIQSSVTVEASAQPEKRLRDLGCDEENPYTPGILGWLSGGRTAKGEFVGDDIVDAWFQSHGHDFRTNLTLTARYWLDIDPTAPGFVFEAGFDKVSFTNKTERLPNSKTREVTNPLLTVFMMVTNESTSAENPYAGQAWAPYTLNGLGSETSADPAAANCWTSVTLQVRGILMNGLTDASDPAAWQTLKWLTFDAGSFDPKTYLATIELPDPKQSTLSPGYAVWHDWIEKHDKTTQIFYSWKLEHSFMTFSTETLKKNHYVDPSIMW